MDFSVIHEYLPLYTEAAKLTVRLGIAGIAISSLVGLFCAMVQYFKIPVLRRIAAIYACLNYNEAYAPDEIINRSICINGDIREILMKM